MKSTLSPPAKISARKLDAMRAFLDPLVAQYKVPGYIDNDPIQIPWRYAGDPKACELAGFITAMFSYGRRDSIIETMGGLFRIAEDDPAGFLESYDPKKDAKLFKHFVYRFNKGQDVAYLWERLQWAYREYGSLENLFIEASRIQASGKNFTLIRTTVEKPEVVSQDSRLQAGIAGFTDILLGDKAPDTYGLKFLFAHPERGGACKRFNMFLRWMVRHDEHADGRVDFGLWKSALTPGELLVPLDTHVLKMNRALGISSRTDGSWRTAEEITRVFRALCPEDPVKYDYALFGFSLDGRLAAELPKGWKSC